MSRKLSRLLSLMVLGSPLSMTMPPSQPYTDAAGFSANLPPGWTVQKFRQGFVRMQSADGQRFVLVLPVLGRAGNCVAMLRRAFAASWSAFPGANGVEISGVPDNPRVAVARFHFFDGRSRGALLCAETGPGAGMYYGVGGPAATFAQEAPGMVAVLQSFRYGTPQGSPPGGVRPPGPVALPRMVLWKEPRELAYTMQVPEGWRIGGGLTRLDVTHARSGVELASPEGRITMRFGDPRLPLCTVPGPGMASMGNSGGLTLCPYQTGRQAGEAYLQRTLAREWGIDGLQLIASRDRTDLNQDADRGPAQFGLRVRNAFAEIHFRGTRRGTPVEGRLLANTQMMASVGGQNFVLGTYTTEVIGFAGPPERVPEMAAISGHVIANMHWSLEWFQREQRISADLARRTLDMMRAQAESQQREFWARMDASDRRREAVNDILGGTVRLGDGEGHTYQAKAGSNYYFLDQEAARRAARPEDAVVGTDLYPSPLVDLKPLEVLR